MGTLTFFLRISSMEEPSIKESRIDGEEVEADELDMSEVGEEAKGKSDEDVAEKVEEEKYARLTLRLKGIPFDGITEADVAAWFPDCEIADEGIFIAPLTRVAYVEFKNNESVQRALGLRNFFQCQSIALTPAKPFHRSKDIAVAAGAKQLSKAPYAADSLVIHIRFLPYWTTEERVMDFYKEFEILAIHMIWDHLGRTGAQCYVEFHSEEGREKALKIRGLGRHAKFTECENSKLARMFKILEPQYIVDDSVLVIRMSNLPWAVVEEDIREFFKPIELIGVYLAVDWLDKGTGIGFITVADYEKAYKVWEKSGHRIETINGKKAAYKESKSVDLLASCATELHATLISMYVREKNGLNRGYGRGRGGFRMGNMLNRGAGGGGGGHRMGDGRKKMNQIRKKNIIKKKRDGWKKNPILDNKEGIKKIEGNKNIEGDKKKRRRLANK